MEIYSFEPLPEPVLSCSGSKEYISMEDCYGHNSVDLPSTELSRFDDLSDLSMFDGNERLFRRNRVWPWATLKIITNKG